MPTPPLSLEIRSSGLDFTLFLGELALTRPFASKEEAHAEFDRLEELLASARVEGLKSFAEQGLFDRPRSVPIKDPRSE